MQRSRAGVFGAVNGERGSERAAKELRLDSAHGADVAADHGLDGRVTAEAVFQRRDDGNVGKVLSDPFLNNGVERGGVLDKE